MHNFENSRQVVPPTWAISTPLLKPPYQPADLTNVSIVGPDNYEPPCPTQIGEVCNNAVDVQTWVTICLPYFEQGSIYNAFNIAQPFSAPVNTTFVGTQLSFMVCPSAPAGYRTAVYTDSLSSLLRRRVVGHACGGRLCGRRWRGLGLDGFEQCSAPRGRGYPRFAARQRCTQNRVGHGWNVEHNHGFGRCGAPSILAERPPDPRRYEYGHSRHR